MVFIEAMNSGRITKINIEGNNSTYLSPTLYRPILEVTFSTTWHHFLLIKLKLKEHNHNSPPWHQPKRNGQMHWPRVFCKPVKSRWVFIWIVFNGDFYFADATTFRLFLRNCRTRIATLRPRRGARSKVRLQSKIQALASGEAAEDSQLEDADSDDDDHSVPDIASGALNRAVILDGDEREHIGDDDDDLEPPLPVVTAAHEEQRQGQRQGRHGKHWVLGRSQFCSRRQDHST